MPAAQPEKVQIPPRPDLRQSLCHTLLAVGFILLGTLKRFVVEEGETSFHWWMMVALGAFLVLSWYVFARRLIRWNAVPKEIREIAVRSAAELKQRAISHLMMALLALLLTGFSFLGLIAMSSDGSIGAIDKFLMGAGGVAAVAAVAILTRTLRDLMALRRLRDKGVTK
jgi:hypothetical protein